MGNSLVKLAIILVIKELFIIIIITVTMAFIIAFIAKQAATKPSLLITTIKEEILPCIAIFKQDSLVIELKLIALFTLKLIKVIIALVIVALVIVALVIVKVFVIIMALPNFVPHFIKLLTFVP